MITRQYILKRWFAAIMILGGSITGPCFAALPLPPPCYSVCNSLSGQDAQLQQGKNELSTATSDYRIRVFAKVPAPISWTCEFACPLP